jgi:aminoglycoside/choline kinase family phosphotransferase
MRLPVMHFADYDSDSGHFCLLIEDLAHLRAISQIDGQGFEDAKSSVQYLARLHSKWWDKSELLGFDWLRNTADSSTFQNLFDMYNDNAGALLEIMSGYISTEIASVIQNYAPKVTDVCKKLAREPMTLNHGDFRLANLFFDDSKQDANAVVPVDWQQAKRARAGTDLATFLMGNLKMADRRKFETQLLAIYYDELVSGGVSDLSYDELLTDIKLGMLHRLISLSAVMGNANIDHLDEDWFKELGERMEVLVDWNCEEVIPR